MHLYPSQKVMQVDWITASVQEKLDHGEVELGEQDGHVQGTFVLIVVEVRVTSSWAQSQNITEHTLHTDTSALSKIL